MDIIDVMLAKSLSSQGQLESYVAKSSQAVQNAQEAIDNAQIAIDGITAASDTIEANLAASTSAKETAEAAVADVNSAIERLDTAIENLDSTTLNVNTIDAEVNKLAVSVSNVAKNDYRGYDLTTTYPDQSTRTASDVLKLYTTYGNNEDGGMTQKAINEAMLDIQEGMAEIVETTQTKIDLGSDNEGTIVIVGPDGSPAAGQLTEQQILQALLEANAYSFSGTVGIEVDYENKSFARIQEAENFHMGRDFDKYPMYGGRCRCNVDNTGAITAFYGDAEYRDDGSNGQVMIYQPRFYYQRTPMRTVAANNSRVIRKESIMISYEPKSGFKVHPLFLNDGQQVLEYVLLPAYEGSAQYANGTYDTNDNADVNFATDMLSSVAGVKPISGVNKEFTIEAAEQMAKNRGYGWHITNLRAESAMQMLQVIEYGNFNGQNSFELGVSNIPNDYTKNCSNLTGSTADLGNASGYAAESTNETGGVITTKNTNGTRSFSYRGTENPWGNIWTMVGGAKVVNGTNSHGGYLSYCQTYDYGRSDRYATMKFYLPSTSNYISGFGYDGTETDWLFIPIEAQGNSALPVGDYVWCSIHPNVDNILLIGGCWGFTEYNGLFNYAADQPLTAYSRTSNARLMFIPEKNSVYEANIQKWVAHQGV